MAVGGWIARGNGGGGDRWETRGRGNENTLRGEERGARYDGRRSDQHGPRPSRRVGALPPTPPFNLPTPSPDRLAPGQSGHSNYRDQTVGLETQSDAGLDFAIAIMPTEASPVRARLGQAGRPPFHYPRTKHQVPGKSGCSATVRFEAYNALNCAPRAYSHRTPTANAWESLSRAFIGIAMRPPFEGVYSTVSTHAVREQGVGSPMHFLGVCSDYARSVQFFALEVSKRTVAKNPDLQCTYARDRLGARVLSAQAWAVTL